jgi:hypothetical protein
MGIRELKREGRRTMITIEPILDFDTEGFTKILTLANPDWINIGADSKHHGLNEPSWEKVEALISNLRVAGINVKEKSNLKRLRRV